MAITGFGQSLLSDVRETRKANLDELRAYNRSREKDSTKDFFKQFIGSKLLDEGLNWLNSKAGEKTKNFLASSDLTNNKLFLDGVQQDIEKELGYEKTYQTANQDAFSYFNNLFAEQELKKWASLNPDKVSEKELFAYKPMFIEKTSDFAKQYANYHNKVIKEADSFLASRDSKSLQAIADEFLPKTTFGKLAFKNVYDTEAINSVLKSAPQMISADRIQKAYSTLEQTGSMKSFLDVAQLSGLNFESENDLNKIQSALKKNHSYVVDVNISSNANGVFSTIVQQETDVSGKAVGLPTIKTEQIVDAKTALTSDNILNIIKEGNQLEKYMSDILTVEGYKAYLANEKTQTLTKVESLNNLNKKITHALSMDWIPEGVDEKTYFTEKYSVVQKEVIENVMNANFPKILQAALDPDVNENELVINLVNAIQEAFKVSDNPTEQNNNESKIPRVDENTQPPRLTYYPETGDFD